MPRNKFDGEFKGGLPIHANGTVGIEHKTITFDPTAQRVIVQNTSVVNKLMVSFDSGSNFFTVLSGMSLDIGDIGVDNIILSGSAAGTLYEVVYVD